MIIENSVMADAVEIARLYESARDLQKIKGAVCWPLFDKKLIETEITEGRQWKIVIDTQIACVWATTFSDPQIWEERNADASVYIHRIATNPIYRGQNLVKEIVRWAKVYAEKNEKEFIRLDTVGENKELIRHYQKCGFDFLGIFNLTNTDQLPAHYHNAGVSLFQMKVN
ncbi:MAG TPA: GNAT family N-acetyltransferase [Cyclobacteriaceae bacterium]|nr:GNAT family N-acetyltransferase [Cyclobacteriaceae bacterium]HNT49809.1 GNAT family N-acetyltransferase [Cyclobacteriaceae bacterium]HRF32748.1 GNAT family N-acetyltransferase [Cyclobacteriaceae bacterium]